LPGSTRSPPLPRARTVWLGLTSLPRAAAPRAPAYALRVPFQPLVRLPAPRVPPARTRQPPARPIAVPPAKLGRTVPRQASRR
jgi:hypothetical protein